MPTASAPSDNDLIGQYLSNGGDPDKVSDSALLGYYQHAKAQQQTAANIAASKADIAKQGIVPDPNGLAGFGEGVAANLKQTGQDIAKGAQIFGQSAKALPGKLAQSFNTLGDAAITQDIGTFAPPGTDTTPMTGMSQPVAKTVLGEGTGIPAAGRAIKEAATGGRSLPQQYVDAFKADPAMVTLNTALTLEGIRGGLMHAPENLSSIADGLDSRAAEAGATGDAARQAHLSKLATQTRAAASILGKTAGKGVPALMDNAGAGLGDLAQMTGEPSTPPIDPDEGAVPADTPPVTPAPAAAPPTPTEAANTTAQQTALIGTKPEMGTPSPQNLSAERQALLAAENARHAEATVGLIKMKAAAQPGSVTYETAQSGLKAAGMQHAANVRQITGNLTATETAALNKYAASNYVGKPVTVDVPGTGPVDGTVVKTVFGRVQVQHPDGTITSHPAAEVTPTVGAPPPEHPALTALRDTLGIPRGSVPEPNPDAVPQVEPQTIVTDAKGNARPVGPPPHVEPTTAAKAIAAKSAAATGEATPQSAAPVVAPPPRFAEAPPGLPERMPIPEAPTPKAGGGGSITPETPNAAIPGNPEAPPEAVAPAPKPTVNRAANLNLDRMDTPAEVKAAIMEDVKTHAAEIAQERGPVTHAETIQAAKDIGLQPSDVAGLAGKALNSHEMLALRQLMLDGKDAVTAAQETYKAAPTPDNGARLAMAAKQYQTLMLSTIGHTAEAGRTLNAFKIMSKAYRSPAQVVEAMYKPPKPSEPPPPPTTSKAFGADNRLFTADKAAAARAALRAAKSRLNSGIDPTLLPHLVELGGYYVEGGIRTFAAWSKEMLKDAPKLSQADLKTLWDKVKPEATKRAQQALSASERVRDELLKTVSGDDVDRLSKDLAGLKPDDYAGFSRVMSKYTKSGTLDKLTTLWKAGLLSGLHTFGKIYTAHGTYLLAEEAAQVPASLADLAISKLTGQRSVGGANLASMGRAAKAAATKGVDEARTIMKGGDTALKLKGSVIPDDHASPFYPEADFGNRLLDAYAHGVFRLHGASYQIMKVYAYTRALDEIHGVNAANVAKGHPPMTEADMQAMAVETMMQRTFINKNALTTAYSSARRALPAAGRAVLDITVPFPKVPTNVVAKLGEYAFGIPISAVQLVKALREGGVTLEQQRAISTTFGRGTVGAAALAVGYKMYRAGLVKPPDHKTYEPGSIYVGGKWQQVGHVQPVGGMVLLGATLGKLWDEKMSGQTPDIGSAVTATFGELPFLSGMGTAGDLLGPDANARDRVVNGLIGSVVPQALSQVAAAQDTNKRKVKTPAEAIERALPKTPLNPNFNRQRLQKFPFAETRDYVNPLDPYAGKPLTLDQVAAMARQKKPKYRP